MRGKKIQRQITKALDYEEIETELPLLQEWLGKISVTDDNFSQKVSTLLTNFPSFLDSIEGSYEQYETNLTHAQRSLELSGQEVEERNKLLRNENRKITNLLNNMRLSVFSVDAQGIIIGPVSRFTENIFGRDISNLNLFEVLYRFIPEKSEELSSVKTAFITVFGEDEIQWELMSESWPKRLIGNFNALHKNEQILKVTTTPLWDDQNILNRIMILVEDVTELEALNQRIEMEKAKGQRNLQIVQELIVSSKDQVLSLFAIFDEMVLFCVNGLNQSKWSMEDIHGIFRNLHTIKGNARTYGFNLLSAMAHEVESEFMILREKAKEKIDSKEFIQFRDQTLIKLSEQMNEYNTMIQRIYSGGSSSESSLSETSKRHIQKIYEIFQTSIKERNESEWEKAHEIFDKLLGLSSLSQLKEYIHGVAEKAAVSSKKVNLAISGVDFLLNPKQLRYLQDAFLHILTNAIDHGIESEDLRRERKKDLNGKIEVRFEVRGSQLYVVIRDDGGGLDDQRIREKILQSGLRSLQQIEEMTDPEVRNFIFEPGFSTKKEVTESSGRGVGLDVVRSNINAIGGKVWVDSAINRGTSFHIQIPLENKISLETTSLAS